ncbi:DUF721 domain-containing protein [bacterium]|nr:DUF721 domain-containing protein [bacterium]
MEQKPKTFSAIGDILGNTIGELNLEKNIRVYTLWKNWDKIVGDYLKTKTHPDFVTGTTLHVSVDHHMILQELEFQKTKLLSKIKEIEKSVVIEKIVFKLKKAD